MYMYMCIVCMISELYNAGYIIFVVLNRLSNFLNKELSDS